MSWKDGMVNYQKSLMQCQGCRRIFEWETASHPDKGVVTLSEYGVEDFHRHGPWTCPFCKGTFKEKDEVQEIHLGDVTQHPPGTIPVVDERPA